MSGFARRLSVWMPTGLAAALFVALQDISGLLGSIESSGQRSFNAQVFTGFRPLFWKTDDLADALALWRDDPTARSLLRWHLGLDLPFIAAYAWLISKVLKRAGVNFRKRWAVAGLIASIDLAETLLTWGIVEAETTSRFWLGLAAVFSLAKWIAVIAVLAIALVWLVKWLRSTESQDFRSAVATSRSGRQSNGISLTGQSVLVVLFALLIALPAGGPLEQVPDVLRYELDGAPWYVMPLSMLALVLFAATLAASSFVGVGTRDPSAPRTIKPWIVPASAGVISVGLILVGRILEGEFNQAALAPVLLASLLWGAAVLARWAGVAGSTPGVTGNKTGGGPVDTMSTRWIGALAGVVLVAAGIGLLRAAGPIIFLDSNDLSGWWFLAGLGLITALFAGVALQTLVIWVSRYLVSSTGEAEPPLRAVIGILFVGSAGLAIGLAIRPEFAARFGVTGAIALAFALFAVVIALLQTASRRGAHWAPTTALGLGARTPWAGLLVATWVVASFLNTTGGYHDIRTEALEANAASERSSLGAALEEWRASQEEECGGGDRLHLVMVAAPGGGIRAAYWTANALEALFPDECARQKLFAISATSGGSVGAVLWQAAIDRGRRPKEAVSGISGDEALASAVAGLLLRDIPQPLTGLTDQWRDRADLLEDGWIERSDVLGSAGSPKTWSDLGAGAVWAPVMVLNSASVADGCRVVISNVRGLPSSSGEDCLTPGVPGGGPMRASIDPLAGLVERGVGCDLEARETARQPTAVGAALLSARFPFITPSGALHHCDQAPTDAAQGGQDGDSASQSRTTYAVDGGYFENSGLLALLEILEELEGLQGLNRTGPEVEPWVVLVDNHYRSTAGVASAPRPKELLVPFQTIRASKVHGQAALEQATATALATDAACPRFGRIGPQTKAGVEAPLGWTLSEYSRRQLDADLTVAIESAQRTGAADRESVDDGQCLAPLLESLGSNTPEHGGP